MMTALPHPTDGIRYALRCRPPAVWLLFCVWSFSCMASDFGVIEEGKNVTLTNGDVAVSFDRDHRGAVASLRDVSTGMEFVAPTGPASLFTLEVIDQEGGSKRVLESRMAKTFEISTEQDSEKAVITLLYEFFDPEVVVTCKAISSRGDGLIRWRMAAKISGGLMIANTSFPVVTLRSSLGATGKSTSMVAGATKGGAWKPEEMKADSAVNWQQPGTLAAQFVSYYGDTAGLYLAAYDDKGIPKQIEARRVPVGVDLSFKYLDLVKGSFSFAYDIVLTTFHGKNGTLANWRDGADIYKEWALKQPWCARTLTQRGDLPAWLKEGAGVARFDREWLTDPSTIEKWAGNFWKKHYGENVPLIPCLWGFEKVGRWIGPDYFPAYPSDEQFKQLTTRLRALGCHPSAWPSGYNWAYTFNKLDDGTFQWDGSSLFEAAKEHAVREIDGTIRVREPSWLRGGSMRQLCPGVSWTRQWFTDRVTSELVRRGIEVIQVDQIVGGRFPFCYAEDHGHPRGPGVWMTEAFSEQLRQIVKAGDAINSGTVVCFEEPNEHFLQLIGIQDYRDCEFPGEWADVFNYLYHEFVPTFQPGLGDNLAWTANCLVNGQMPHMVPSFRAISQSEPVNGNFELFSEGTFIQWSQGKEFRGKTCTGKVLRDESGGSAAIVLRNDAITDVVQVSQNVNVSGDGFQIGGTYRLTAKARQSAGTGRGSLICQFFAKGWKPLEGGGEISISRKQGESSELSVDLTVPKDAAFLRIMLLAEGKTEARFDDVTLLEVKADGSLVPVPTVLPDNHKLLQRWVELYSGEGKPWLVHGTVLHPPRLETALVPVEKRTVPAILHNAFRAPDGREAVIAANATSSPQEGTLTWKGREQVVRLGPGEAALIIDSDTTHNVSDTP